MIVYVCYFDQDYDGCSAPQVVYSTEEAAKKWVETYNSHITRAAYDKYEVDEEYDS